MIRNKYMSKHRSSIDKMRENRLRWFGYEERLFGSSKNGYGIERGKKKSKGRTKQSG